MIDGATALPYVFVAMVVGIGAICVVIGFRARSRPLATDSRPAPWGPALWIVVGTAAILVAAILGVSLWLVLILGLAFLPGVVFQVVVFQRKSRDQ
jgi:hypothetical protein